MFFISKTLRSTLLFSFVFIGGAVHAGSGFEVPLHAVREASPKELDCGSLLNVREHYFSTISTDPLARLAGSYETFRSLLASVESAEHNGDARAAVELRQQAGAALHQHLRTWIPATLQTAYSVRVEAWGALSGLTFTTFRAFEEFAGGSGVSDFAALRMDSLALNFSIGASDAELLFSLLRKISAATRLRSLELNVRIAGLNLRAEEGFLRSLLGNQRLQTYVEELGGSFFFGGRALSKSFALLKNFQHLKVLDIGAVALARSTLRELPEISGLSSLSMRLEDARAFDLSVIAARFPGLRSLQVVINGDVSDRPVEREIPGLARLTQLQKLSLRGIALEGPAVRALADLPLRELHVYSMNAHGLRALAKIPSLRTLTLEKSAASQLKALAEGAHALEGLAIARLESASSDSLFAELAKMKGLRALRIPLPRLSEPDFWEMTRLQNLRVLQLSTPSDPSYTEEDGTEVFVPIVEADELRPLGQVLGEAINQLPNLAEIGIRDNQSRRGLISALLSGPHREKVRSLALNAQLIEDADVSRLVGLSALSQLNWLSHSLRIPLSHFTVRVKAEASLPALGVSAFPPLATDQGLE